MCNNLEKPQCIILFIAPLFTNILSGVKLKLFCPEAKNSSPLFKFIEVWGADLIEWGVILVEVNFYHSLSSQLKEC
jgi:hypothetical protein